MSWYIDVFSESVYGESLIFSEVWCAGEKVSKQKNVVKPKGTELPNR